MRRACIAVVPLLVRFSVGAVLLLLSKKNLRNFLGFGAPFAVGYSHYKKFIQNSLLDKKKHTVRFNFNLIILPSLGDLKKQTKNETNLFIRLDPEELFS